MKKLLLPLFALITVFFLACEKDFDTIQESNEQNNEIALWRFPVEKILQYKPEIKKQFEKIKTNNAQAKLISNTYGFSIEESEAQVVFKDNYTQYTFIVNRDNPIPNVLENYICRVFNSGEVQQFLVAYPYNVTQNGVVYDNINASMQIIDDNSIIINPNAKYSLGCTTELVNSYSYTTTVSVPCTGDGHDVGDENCECGITSDCTAAHIDYETVTVNEWETICPGESSGSGGGEIVTPGDSGGTTTTPEDEEPILTIPFELELKTPCDLIKKLQEDTNFKSRMSGLINAARQWSFEHCHVLYNADTPISSNNYTYQSFSGSIGSPFAEYSGNTSMQAVIHSHNSGTLSVFSTFDLYDLYLKMKNNLISDDFFIAVVTASNTAYLLQVPDRAALIAFGDKYFPNEKELKKFMLKTVAEKYGINPNNTNLGNEKGFLKMISEFNTGLSLYSVDFDANTPASASLFDTWTKKEYNKKTSSVSTSNCN